jgi:hypothetical protein
MIRACLSAAPNNLELGLVHVATLALLVLTGAISPAAAETFCVGTAAELQTALDDAEANAENDAILLLRGTYTGNFSFSSSEHKYLLIRGGYDPNCVTHGDDPSNTVLDAQGSGTVLSLYQHAGGAVHVEGVTLQNGGYHGLWVRLINELQENSIDDIHLVNCVIKDCRTKSGAYIMSEPGDTAFAGPILIYDNSIIGCSGERSGLTVMADWNLPGGSVVLRNNVIAGNVSTLTCGGLTITNYDNGSIYLTNNTIIDNETLSTSTTVPGGFDVGVGTGLDAFNNIFWGNLSPNGPADLDVVYYDPAGIGTGFNNDYGEMGGSWHVEAGNQNVDPGFVSRGFWQVEGPAIDSPDDVWVAGDSHLGPDSPCIDTGSDAAPGPGVLPAEDFEGDPRIVDGDGDGLAVVDIGADESTVIFRDGFDSGGTSAWSGSTP